MRRKNIFALLGLCSCLLLAQAGRAWAEDYGATARGLFTMLPPSIFESTPEGLSEADKQEMLATGSCAFWEIAGETPDVMVFASLPLRDKALGLRIFRNDVDGSVEAAVGTIGEPVCSLELWRLDTAGRLVPIDAPEEPKIWEFFKKGRKISKNAHPSVLICLGAGGLVANPVFWDESGRVFLNMDNEISFQWNGHKFEKRIKPLEK